MSKFRLNSWKMQELIRPKNGVYLIEFTTGIKIGMSYNIHKRVKYLKDKFPGEVVSVHYLECQYPTQVEKQLLTKFKMNITTALSTEFITDVKIDSVLCSLIYLRKSALPGMFINERIAQREVQFAYFKYINRIEYMMSYSIPTIDIMNRIIDSSKVESASSK